MNIQTLNEYVSTFRIQVCDSEFRRDLEDFTESLPGNEDNIISQREVAKKISAVMLKIQGGDLHAHGLSVQTPSKAIIYHLSVVLLLLAGSAVIPLHAAAGREATKTASVPVVSVEKEGEVKVNGVPLRARTDGWGVLGLEKAELLPLPRPLETGIYRAWIENGLGIWASTVPAGPNNTQMMYRVRLSTMGMQEVPDLVFRGVVELRGQRLDFTRPKLHGREAVKKALLNRNEEVQWSVDERMLRFVEGGMVIGVDFSPDGDAIQEVSISHFEKLDKPWPKSLSAEAKATAAVYKSVVSVEKDGEVKLNGVVLEPKPTNWPKWLEKAVVLETLMNNDGTKVEMWGHRDSGIMLTTRTLGLVTVPELVAVDMYADGSPDDSTLIFRGVLVLRGQRLDFSQSEQTRRADLDKLRRPDETEWKWSETGTILQFREGATGLLLHLSSQDGGVNEAMIYPKRDEK